MKEKMSEEERKKKAKAATQKWRLANPDKVKEQRRKSMKRLRLKNPAAYYEKLTPHVKNWRDRNPERVKKYRVQAMRRIRSFGEFMQMLQVVWKLNEINQPEN